MYSQVLTKLIEITFNVVQDDISGHEVEDRLVDNLLGKELEFTTQDGSEGVISFHSIGRGSKVPSSVVTLQVKGIEFDQEPSRLSHDLRYIYYKTHGHSFFVGSPTEFLVTSPFVRKLGPSNILIEFVIYGDTIHQVNRCLAVFAKVIKKHQSSLHQTTIERYKNGNTEFDDDSDVSLEEPLSNQTPSDDPLEITFTIAGDEVYIEEYTKYLDNYDEFQTLIDNRNTFAESKLD